MASIINTVTIAGAPAAVFDLVTTARFWPQWHPASAAVGGVTQRPYQRGDVIHERGRVGPMPFQVLWKVVEHVRPSKVVLQAEQSPARIGYTVQPSAEGTVFTRELVFDEERLRAAVPDPDGLSKLMRDQQAQALNQLKELVEKVLKEEAVGLP